MDIAYWVLAIGYCLLMESGRLARQDGGASGEDRKIINEKFAIPDK